MKVLGIETSCDETGVAIYDTERGLLANQLYSQVALHSRYGGVVPELASRDHIRKLPLLVTAALAEANLEGSDLEGIGYTRGPGLLGALMVGAAFAKGMGASLGIASLGVHHMEGHLMAPFLEREQPSLPFIALLVSGGHTLLVAVKQLGCYEILGESLDDAAGEAFDKTAKLLGLPYPGGAELAHLARLGNKQAFHFPRPLLKEGLQFSFSGLKTAALQVIKAQTVLSDALKQDLAASFEAAIVDTLVVKSLRALRYTGFKTLVVSGGVSANHSLRQQLQAAAIEESFEVFYPRPAFCTDNGAMIALLGALRLQAQEKEAMIIDVRARFPLTELQEISHVRLPF